MHSINVIRENPARLKVGFERLKGYAVVYQMAMIFVLFSATLTQFEVIITIVALGLVTVVITVLDFKFVLPREQEAMFQKNPLIMEMKADVKQIKELLNNDRAVCRCACKNDKGYTSQTESSGVPNIGT